MSLLCTLVLAGFPPAAADAPDPSDLYSEAYPVADLLGGGADDFGELADRVIAATGRENWATFGGPGTIRPAGETADLVVRQTTANHEAVVAALGAWRRVSILTELVVLELPAGAPLPAPPADGGPVVVTDGPAFVRSAVAAGAVVLSRPTMVILAGQEGTVVVSGESGRGVACRYRPEVGDDGVRLALAAAFDGADAPAPAGDGVRVRAGASAVYRFVGADGPTRVIVATPGVSKN